MTMRHALLAASAFAALALSATAAQAQDRRGAQASSPTLTYLSQVPASTPAWPTCSS